MALRDTLLDLRFGRYTLPNVAYQTTNLGPELLTNGDFDDVTDWTLPLETDISAGTLNFTATTAARSVVHDLMTPAIGKKYLVTWDITSRSAGGITVVLGGVTINYRTGVTSHSSVVTALTTERPRVNASSGTTLSVDNISIKEILPAYEDALYTGDFMVRGPELIPDPEFDTGITGWLAQGATISWEAGKLKVVTGGAGGAIMDVPTVPGRMYEMKASWANAVSSSSRAYAGGGFDTILGFSGDFAGPLTKTVAFIASGTTTRIYLRNTGASTQLYDSVSVREARVFYSRSGPTKGEINAVTRKNWVRNNQFYGGVAGSPGVSGKFNIAPGAPGGCARTISYGIEDGMRYVEYAYEGTPTTSGAITIMLDDTLAIPAKTGQTWTASVYARVLENIGTAMPSAVLYEINSAGSQTANPGFVSVGKAASLGANRKVITYTNSGGANTIGMLFRIQSAAYTAGVYMKYVLRYAMAQAEQSSFVTDAIETYGAAVEKFDHGGIRRNYVRNNQMVGAVPGSPGTLANNWFNGTIPAGVTRTIVGTGTMTVGDQVIAYKDIKYEGTGTGYFDLTFEMSDMPVVQGTAATGSVYLALVDGSYANVTDPRLIMYASPGFNDNDVLVASALTTQLQLFRLTRQFTLAGTTGASFRLAWTLAGNVNFTIRIGDPVLEFGGAVTYPRIPTNGAIGVDGVGVSNFTIEQPPIFANRGLSTRQAIQNQILQNQSLQNSSWNKANITTGTLFDDIIAPDGTLTADRLTEAATTSEHYIDQTRGGLPANAPVTHSAFVRMGTGRYAALQIYESGATANSAWCYVDLALGTVTATGVGGVATIQLARVIYVGDGWFRIVLVTTLDSASVNSTMICRLRMAGGTSGTSGSYLGSTSTYIHAWQVQTLVGNFPDGGPIIANEGGTLTSGEDLVRAVVPADTTDGPYVIVAKAKLNVVTASTTRVLAVLNDGTNNNRVQLMLNSAGALAAYIMIGGVLQTSQSTIASAIGEVGVLVRWNGTNWSIFAKRAGMAAAHLFSTVAGVTQQLTQMHIGTYLSPGSPMQATGEVTSVQVRKGVYTNDDCLGLLNNDFIGPTVFADEPPFDRQAALPAPGAAHAVIPNNVSTDAQLLHTGTSAGVLQ